MTCTVCGHSVEPPNVRWAVSEQGDLQAQHEAALADLEGKRARSIGTAYEAAVASSKAVIAVSPSYALSLLENDTLHQSYHAHVDGGGRLSAAPTDDFMRRSVDAKLFGSAAPEITMAALSLSRVGLSSYGQVNFTLKERMCAERASLLSENSYHFVRRIGAFDDALPTGFRSTWHDRGKLALVKAAPKLTSATPAAEFPHILMRSTGDRQTDDFVEVHIYGRWNADAVESMTLMRRPTADSFEKALFDRLGDRARERGLKVEYAS